MSNILFANNASTILAAPISSGATSVTLATGTGSEFPAPTGGQYFVMTFVNASTGLINEIVHVTARTGDVCTILRAQEGTAAAAWLAGDTAANFWTAGSILALEAGFPTGSNAYSSNTAISTTDAGNLIRVGGSAIMTLPNAATVSGMAIGFSALTACTIAITPTGGSLFAGGAINATNSASLRIGEYLCVQSNGTNWVIFAASPDVFLGDIVALQSWVSANFDPLGSASTAQTNAENFALTLVGNLSGVDTKTAGYTLLTSDFGALLILSSTAAGNTVFHNIDGTTIGQSIWYTNRSATFNLTVQPAGSSTAQYAVVGQPGILLPSFVIPPGGAAFATWQGANWVVSYFTAAFDPAGAATAAIASVLATISGQLPFFSKTASLSTTTANNTTYTLTTQAVTFPAFGITGGFRVKARAVLSGATTAAAMLQNFSLSLTDGTHSESGAAWLVSNPQAAANESDVESTFFINNVYAQGASVTFTLKVSTLGGGGGGFTGQLVMSSCHLDISVENA